MKANAAAVKKNGKKAEAKEADITTLLNEKAAPKKAAAAPKKEPSKSAVKKDQKEVRAKLADASVADKELGPCAICGKPIRVGHVLGRLVADANNPARLYHKKTCGPGTKPWTAFKANGKKVAAAAPEAAKEAPKAEAKKAAEKGGNGEDANGFGHRPWSRAGKLDALLDKGCTVDDVVKIGIKPRRFTRHRWHLMKKHGVTVTEKDGAFRFPAGKSPF